MIKLLIPLAVILFITQSYAVSSNNNIKQQLLPCANYTTCSGCTSNPSCGWCGPTQQCFNGTAVQPLAPNKCYGEYWFYGTASCPNCTSLKDCKSCLYMDSDCAWCGSTSECIEWGDRLGCNPVDECPCNIYGTCSECLKDVTCKWCNGTCKPQSDLACPFPAHSCPCSDNFDCDSCFADAEGGCVWCDEPGSLGYCATSNANCMIAHNCNSYCQSVAKTCAVCNQVPGCGWCLDSNSCVDASESSCFLRHTCPQCNYHKYCDPCQDDGCVWCKNEQNPGGICKSPDDTNNCFIQHTCESYCQGYATCSECNDIIGCGWCEESTSCVDADKSQCFLVHSCPAKKEKCGFDGGAFVGGMFLGIGLVAIGIGGYLFYRYKMGGGRGAYRELH